MKFKKALPYAALGLISCAAPNYSTNQPNRQTTGQETANANYQISQYSEVDETAKQLSPPIQAGCFTVINQCLHTVKTARTALMATQNIDNCTNDLSELQKRQCEDGAMVIDGNTTALNKFESIEADCLNRILTCRDQIQQQIIEKTIEEQRLRRKNIIENDRSLVADELYATNTIKKQLAIAEEALPQQAQDKCDNDPVVKECRAKNTEEWTTLNRNYQIEMAKEDATFREYEAKKYFKGMHAIDRECYQQQLKCIEGLFKDYGATSHTNTVYQKSLELAKEQAALSSDKEQTVVDKCLNGTKERHYSSLQSAKQKYANKPDEFWRTVVLKQIIDILEEQNDCLKNEK
ncbi:hypothetical protein GF340_02745 [Candidatus Peregrinibacteria bacterium]|nr:hypothetical protein [Candidatus Peregrinibacteria bacterium]